MINKIYTFGTSFTEGGGFEFQVNKDIQHAYSNLGEPISKNNFSYPGQLQKLLTEIEVINLAKSGYGNERMYRLATDLVLSDDFNVDDTLFLLEFSHLGRKEFFSRKLNDYIITNYSNESQSESGFTECNGFARTYNQPHDISISDLEKLPTMEFFSEFLKLTVNFDKQHELVTNNSTIFLSFLKNRNVKYLLVEPASYLSPKYWDDLLEPYFINMNQHNSIHSFCNENIAKIQGETYKYHEDAHYGLISNKLIASHIHDEMCDRSFIDSEKLNKKRSDFDDIQNIIKQNVISIKGGMDD